MSAGEGKDPLAETQACAVGACPHGVPSMAALAVTWAEG